MKKIILFASILFLFSCQHKEEILPEPAPEPSSPIPHGPIYNPTETAFYYPTREKWDTVSLEKLKINRRSISVLYNYLASHQTKAFMVLKDGRIVLEQYFNGHTDSSTVSWGSAGQAITSYLIFQSGLDIHTPTSTRLQRKWTSLPIEKENLITAHHQLSMTTGLEDAVSNPTDTTPSNMVYKADAGTRWAFHDAPYEMLEQVRLAVVKKSFHEQYYYTLSNIGMWYDWKWVNGKFLYHSNARIMAKYGLLIMRDGTWSYGYYPSRLGGFISQAMLKPSQTINPSYGYGWWLNGKGKYIIPHTQTVVNTDICPNAPKDMIAAIGENGQLLNISNSKGLIIVRMGETASDDPMGFELQNTIWGILNTAGF